MVHRAVVQPFKSLTQRRQEDLGDYQGPQWSDISEVTSGPVEEKENEQDVTDKDRDTPQPRVKTKSKMNNGK